MKLKIFSSKIISGFFIAVLVFSVALSSHKVFAAAGDIQVTVTEEGDAAAISGASVLVTCTGGVATALTGSPTTNGSGIVSAAPQVASSCDNGDSVILTIAKDGYVTKTVSGLTYIAASSPNVYTATGVQFAYKVTGVTDELSNALSSGVTITTGDAFGTTCIANGGAWYCSVPLANTGVAVSIAKDGYVTNTATSFASDRVAPTDAQVTAVAAGVKYALKVTARNAFTTIVSGATVTAGDSFSTTCSENGSTGIYYCAIPLANTGILAKVVSTGNDTGTVAYTDRIAATDAQGVVSFTTNITASGSAPSVTMPTNPSSSAIISTTNSSSSSSSTSTTSTQTYAPATTTTPAVITGCAGASLFSTITGQSCAGASSTVTPPTVMAPMAATIEASSMVVSADVTKKSSVDSIMALQLALNKALGSELAVALKADGKWGAKTTNAIKMFQKASKLKSDGKVGLKTSAALNSSIK
jgi:hypothetical protein